jgi:hypothetical protein
LKSSKEEDVITGTEDRTPAETGARFWSKVDLDGPWVPYMDTPCWVWTAHTDKDGYGKFKMNVGGKWKGKRAHAVAFYLAEGRWGGPMILHHCDNPACVRRDHLFEGDAKANSDDMRHKGRGRNQDHESCVNGHEFNEVNTYWRSETRRMCRACDRERKQAARTGRTSDSSKSSTGEDASTGTAAPTRADLVRMTRAEFEAYVRGERR